MGLIRSGPPTELMLELRRHYDVHDFIECGTFLGSTAAWAAGHFEHVTTVEYSRELYEQAAAQYGGLPNVTFVFGDSRSALRQVVPTLQRPAIFWLDSHWSGGNTYGENDECPLIDEIQVINASPCTHFAFIDDARMFTAPPPAPHRPEAWPTIDTVLTELKASQHAYYIVIFEDVIIAVPETARPTVVEYCQRASTLAWQHHLDSLNERCASRGLRLIGQGMKLLGEGVRSRLRRVRA